MKRGLLLLVFLVICDFGNTMVPRDRRAVNTEEEELMRSMTTSTTTEGSEMVCAYHTPCAWSIYKPVFKDIEMNITNTYCICGSGTVCQITNDDSTVSAFVLMCRPPKPPSENASESSES